MLCAISGHDRDAGDFRSGRIHDVHGARHAGIEGVDGAQDFDRPRRIGDRRADQRLLPGPRWPCASRGEPFQTVATTAW